MSRVKKKKLPPKAPSNFRMVLTEELLALWSFITSNWIYVLPGILLLVVVVYLVRPVPPKTVTIATGQAHSSADVVGHQYREFFRQYGVNLELVKTRGNEENLLLLEQGKVDAVFSQGGMPLGENTDHLLSLGAISNLPLWLFYHGAEAREVDLNSFLTGRRTSVNIKGSSTQALLRPILADQGIDITASPGLVHLNTAESIQAFKDHKIDALFLAGSMDSKNLRDLVLVPGARIYSFKLADAYARHFPYLSALTLPAGSFKIHPPLPVNDVRLIASTLDLLTTDALHPALQLLFMEATADFEAHRMAYFSRGRFPAYIDTRIPESDVARRYFKSGSPVLWGRAPYWVASLFDEAWFYLLAIGAIVIPLVSFVPSYRRTHASLSIESCYDDLRRIEVAISRSQTGVEPLDPLLLEEIGRLKDRARELWVPTGNRTAYYDLLAAIHIVREDLLASLNRAAGAH